MMKLSEKKYNYYKKKLYRYKKLNIKPLILETEIFIAIYENRFLDAIDLSNELYEFKKSYCTSFVQLLQNYLDKKKKEDEINSFLSKSLIDLTEEEAVKIGGDTLREFYYIEDKLCKFLSSNINKATVIECDTLRELINICEANIKK